MHDYVGINLILRVPIWVTMETKLTFHSYYIKEKINPMHVVNL